MTTSEKLLERKLVKACKELGWWAIKFLPFQLAGLPDRIVLKRNGGVFFVEIKSTGGVVSPRQARTIKKLREFGFQVYILDSMEELTLLIKIEIL